MVQEKWPMRTMVTLELDKEKLPLYKEKEVVKRNGPEKEAVDELIALIAEHGDWIEVAEA